MAPDAQAFFTSCRSNRYNNFRTLVNTHNIMFTTASWGSPRTRQYTSVSAEADDIGRAALSQVGLADKEANYPNQLSGGQQQRVAIARALALEPRIMLFDEPTSALDPELVGSVLQVMRDMRDAGMTMVVVSHELQFAREAADRVVFMDGGVVVEEGPPEQIFGAPEHPRTRDFVSRIARH